MPQHRVCRPSRPITDPAFNYTPASARRPARAHHTDAKRKEAAWPYLPKPRSLP